MKPNIVMEYKGTTLAIYQEVLQKKIEEVCSKINYPYGDIKWIIFDSKKRKGNHMQNLLVGKKGENYAYCIPKENKIFISELAIRSGSDVTNHLLTKSYLHLNNSDDFLAEIIMDELAHISTKLDHGDKGYEDELDKFKRMYY